MTTTDLSITDLAPVLTDAGIRIVRDTRTCAVAIVLDAQAADLLDAYLDALGSLHDMVDSDADVTTMAAADLMLTLRGLLRS